MPLLLLVPTPRARLPEPMYATLGRELPRGERWTFEPKYDGMRVLAARQFAAECGVHRLWQAGARSGHEQQ